MRKLKRFSAFPGVFVLTNTGLHAQRTGYKTNIQGECRASHNEGNPSCYRAPHFSGTFLSSLSIRANQAMHTAAQALDDFTPSTSTLNTRFDLWNPNSVHATGHFSGFMIV